MCCGVFFATPREELSRKIAELVIITRPEAEHGEAHPPTLAYTHIPTPSATRRRSSIDQKGLDAAIQAVKRQATRPAAEPHRVVNRVALHKSPSHFFRTCSYGIQKIR